MKSLRNLPIPRKLFLMIGVLALAPIGSVVLSYFAIDALAATRAYIGGESLWSKAQKQATYHLGRYAHFRDETDFQQFQAHLAIPLGDRKARIELQKDSFDAEIARQGFLEGGNHPEDLAGMIRLFRYFGGFGYMKRAIAIWTEGDTWIEALRQAGEALREEIQRGKATPASIKAHIARIDDINARLTPLEEAFSRTLGDAARFLKRAGVLALVMGTLGVCGLALLLGGSMARDLTSQINRLRDANQELDAYSYSISHDLRAPLRAIDGFAQILNDDHAKGLPPEGQKLIGSIRRNAVQMGQLIDGLLAFARLGFKPLTLQRLELNPIVEEAVAELRNLERDRQLEVVVGPMGYLEGDATLLRQVFANLVSNAIKFTRGRTPARIEVGRHQEHERSVFYVKDNGVGFDPKFSEKLFSVFQRLHSEKEFEGTGVGLALVQRIVARHGGTVWAQAKPGEGACFYLAFKKA